MTSKEKKEKKIKLLNRVVRLEKKIDRWKGEKKELEVGIKEAQEKLHKATENLGKLLGYEGKHKVGDKRVDATLKLVKSRKSTSWATVSTNMRKYFDLLQTKMYEKFGEEFFECIKCQTDCLTTKYEETVEMNTNRGKDETKWFITVL